MTTKLAPPTQAPIRSVEGAALPPVPTTFRDYFIPGQMPSFLEATLDDLLEEHGSRAVSARVLDEGQVVFAPLDGPLGLDVELALDRLTTEMAQVRAQGLTLSDALAQAPRRSLSEPTAARLDVVFACMERILAHFGDGMLTGSAYRELEALMTEAEALLGEPQTRARPGSDAAQWRETLTLLGRQVLARLPDIDPRAGEGELVSGER
ncbi:hypothetical protein [Pararhodospirillum photometricum]|uniref:Uncharacterized protein n=1 Tax=Pararhodospirillum photometricum DSM 122 TaxID=1150469 RepID=H6SNQ8_PARPM|nr:hypothetical protein [Pararhodospirillum photometricum]CCG09389.1 Putative uncharacterized protein [Pararhodospirillum photometricum DSM 122]